MYMNLRRCDHLIREYGVKAAVNILADDPCERKSFATFSGYGGGRGDIHEDQEFEEKDIGHLNQTLMDIAERLDPNTGVFEVNEGFRRFFEFGESAISINGYEGTYNFRIYREPGKICVNSY